MKDQIHILIVEDDDVDLQAIMRAFKKAEISHPVYHAFNGIEALEMLRGTNGRIKLPKPNLLLLDINMPMMNGIELLKEIRRDDDLLQTMVFILTTSKRDEDRIAAYNLNVAGYILKENLDKDLLKLINFLDLYWSLVEFP